METITTFRIDFSPNDDPHDLGLCYFSVEPWPSLSTACYLQIYEIENFTHLTTQFSLDRTKLHTQYAFNRFEKAFAGGAAEIKFFRREDAVDLHLALITTREKEADMPAMVVEGKASLDSFSIFAGELKAISAGSAVSASLEFVVVLPSCRNE
jgi:hypothetical protein